MEKDPAGVRELPQATLRFLSGWQEVQLGAIRPGGKLLIEYDPERLPDCRVRRHEAEVWDIEVYVHFQPGGQIYRHSVLEKIRSHEGRGAVIRLVPKVVEVLVPTDASRVELWFRNSYQLRGGCETWDSRFGQNYGYEVRQSRTRSEAEVSA